MEENKKHLKDAALWIEAANEYLWYAINYASSSGAEEYAIKIDALRCQLGDIANKLFTECPNK